MEDTPLNTLARIRAFAIFAFLAGGVALGGCNSTSSSTPAVPCTVPSGPIALVYPATGSTGIPDNFPGVVFATQSGLPFYYQAVLQAAQGGTPFPLAGMANAPSPLPSPNQLPTFTNPIYQLSSFSGLLSPATNYTVYFNNGYSNCTAVAVGSFTSR